MFEILSFEDWKTRYISIPNELVEDLQKIHNIDAHKEIDRILRDEYQFYLEQANPR